MFYHNTRNLPESLSGIETRKSQEWLLLRIPARNLPESLSGIETSPSPARPKYYVPEIYPNPFQGLKPKKLSPAQIEAGPEIYPNPFQGLKRLRRRPVSTLPAIPEIYPNPFQGLKLWAQSEPKFFLDPRNLPESLSGIET